MDEEKMNEVVESATEVVAEKAGLTEEETEETTENVKAVVTAVTQKKYKSWAMWAGLGGIAALVVTKLVGADVGEEVKTWITIGLSLLAAFGVINNPNSKTTI